MSETKTATAAEMTWGEAQEIDRTAAAKRRAAQARQHYAGGFKPEDLDAIFGKRLAEDSAASEGAGQ